MLDEISTNVAETIPFRTFKEKILIVKKELIKGRHVEIWNGYVYSARKWKEVER